MEVIPALQFGHLVKWICGKNNVFKKHVKFTNHFGRSTRAMCKNTLYPKPKLICMSKEKNRNGDNDRLASEVNDIGIWFICPQCMSKEAWEISCKLKNIRLKTAESLTGKLENQRLIGSFCKHCGFTELTTEGKQMGFDKINWDLMKKEID